MKYSIIIPIYNSCQTLQRCLDSILHQSYSDFEVLMIDDGSEDNSAEIASLYSKKDNRFYLIRQKNKGPSAARNQGLDQAQGDVVAFVDSDDFVAPDYLEQIDHVFSTTRAQIVFLVLNK